MLKTLITNKDDFERLPHNEWNAFFALFHKLSFEKSLCLVEDIYRRYSQLSYFKFSFAGEEKNIESLNFYLYDIDSNPLLLPLAAEELKQALHQMLLMSNIESIYKQFAVIKRTDRFDLYRVITKDIENFHEVINSWEKGSLLDYRKEKIISFKDVSLPERIVSVEQINSEEWKSNELKFIMLQLDFGLLRCQQFLWSIDLLFKENEGLESLLFQFNENNGLEISCRVKEGVSNIKGESFERLNKVLDASLMLFGSEKTVEIFRDTRIDTFKRFYINARDYRFSERILESIEYLKIAE